MLSLKKKTQLLYFICSWRKRRCSLSSQRKCWR